MRSFARGFAATMLIVVSGESVGQASFDCGLARTDVELTICGDETLAAADGELGRAYAAARARDPAVRAEQLAWVRERNSRCGADASCLREAIHARLGALNERLDIGGSAERPPQITVARSASAPEQSKLSAPNTAASPLAGVAVVRGARACDGTGSEAMLNYAVIDRDGTSTWATRIWSADGYWLPPEIEAGPRFEQLHDLGGGVRLYRRFNGESPDCLVAFSVGDTEILAHPLVTADGRAVEPGCVGQPPAVVSVNPESVRLDDSRPPVHQLTRCLGAEPNALTVLRRDFADESRRIEAVLLKIMANPNLTLWARQAMFPLVTENCQFADLTPEEKLSLALDGPRPDRAILDAALPPVERAYFAWIGRRMHWKCRHGVLEQERFGSVDVIVAPEAVVFAKRTRGVVDETGVQFRRVPVIH